MSRKTALAFLLLAGFALGKDWNDQDINVIFQTLYNQGAQVAVQEVNTFDVTAYDFGLDLLSMNRASDALRWYEAMILVGENPNKFRFAKAWVQMDNGDTQSALTTVNGIIQTSDSSSLEKARAHYMLAVFYYRVGSPHYSSEAAQAESLYEELGLSRGVKLCQSFSTQSKVDPASIPWPPPRDDGGS